MINFYIGKWRKLGKNRIYLQNLIQEFIKEEKPEYQKTATYEISRFLKWLEKNGHI